MDTTKEIIKRRDGCRFADELTVKSSCFECPFEDCIFCSGIKRAKEKRKGKAKELKRQGYPVEQIALELKVTQQTVRNYLNA